MKGVLDSLAKRGLIGSFGVSASTLDVLKFASETDFGHYSEWSYSVFERRFETDFAKILRQRKQCFIGRSPLFRGLITESFLRDGPANYFSDVRSQLPQKTY
ncbi:aldo/keto reductase [Agarivorans sp. MS3-6]